MATIMFLITNKIFDKKGVLFNETPKLISFISKTKPLHKKVVYLHISYHRG